MECPLCQFQCLTHLYYEDALWVICECEARKVPMCVYKPHQEYEEYRKAKRPPESQMQHIKQKCHELFGENIVLDMGMVLVPRHFHSHVLKRG